jgi:hypothetical protein
MKLHSTLLCLALVTPLALLARAPGDAGGGSAIGSSPTAAQAPTAKLV